MDEREMEWCSEEEIEEPVMDHSGPSPIELVADFVTSLRIRVEERCLPLFDRSGWMAHLIQEITSAYLPDDQ